jgi:hypothetical protein
MYNVSGPCAYIYIDNLPPPPPNPTYGNQCEHPRGVTMKNIYERTDNTQKDWGHGAAGRKKPWGRGWHMHTITVGMHTYSNVQ